MRRTVRPFGSSQTRDRARARAFTLVELLIVMVLMGIVFGLALPVLGDSRELRLQSAARMLAADLELAQSESMAHPDDPRLLRIDPPNHQYWIAAVSSPATPITDPTYGGPYRVTFGAGRASGLAGVTIQAYSLGGDTELRFDAFGTPDATTTSSITLACGPATLVVQVAPDTGEVNVP